MRLKYPDPTEKEMDIYVKLSFGNAEINVSATDISGVECNTGFTFSIIIA